MSSNITAVQPAETSLFMREGQKHILVGKDDKGLQKQVVRQVSADATLQATLRNLLPQQASIQKLLSSLVQVLRGGEDVNISPQTRNAVKALLEKLPNAQEIKATATLRKALQNSGVFFEANLLAGAEPNSLAMDFKVLLLRLKALIRKSDGNVATRARKHHKSKEKSPQDTTTPSTGKLRLPSGTVSREQIELPADLKSSSYINKELIKHLDASIARVQLCQVASLQQDNMTQSHWLIELPLRFQERVDIIRLDIRKKSTDKGDQAQEQWHTQVSLNFNRFGPIQISIHMTQKKVSLAFWAEKKETTSLIQQHADNLRSGFRGLGFEVAKMDCHLGKIEVPDPTSFACSLLDQTI